MSLTLSELELHTRHQLGEMRNKPIDSVSIKEAVNSAMEAVAGESFCVQKEAYKGNNASYQYIEVPDDYIDIEAFLWNYNVGTYPPNFKAVEINFNFEQLGQRGFDYSQDIKYFNPRIVYPHGDKLWLDVPVSFSAEEICEIIYYAFPAKLANPYDVSEVKYPWVKLVPIYAAMLISIRLNNHNRAAMLSDRYEKGMAAMIQRHAPVTVRMRARAGK